MKNKLITMLEMQESFNKVVNPEWRDANYRWADAIMMESAELLDHYGYKWWKKTTPDIPQCKMELVDIWHFIMSGLMQKFDGSNESLAHELEIICDGLDVCGVDQTPLREIKHLIRMIISDSAANIIDEAMILSFFELIYAFDMTVDDLYKMYIGKNTLNKFRQDNGYKTGEYIKIWNGKEDNEVLTEILDSLDTGIPFYPTRLYEILENEYSHVTNNE